MAAKAIAKTAAKAVARGERHDSCTGGGHESSSFAVANVKLLPLFGIWGGIWGGSCSRTDVDAAGGGGGRGASDGWIWSSRVLIGLGWCACS
jgi:hypothetical protein